MKKLKIFLCAVGIIITISAVVYVLICWYEAKRPVAVFGIDERDYQVIEKKNTLKITDYDGRYFLHIRIEENQVQSVCDKVHNAGFANVPLEMLEEEVDEIYLRNTTGLEREEIGEGDIIYSYIGAVKRKALALTWPKTVRGIVVFNKNEDGSYDVYLSYAE